MIELHDLYVSENAGNIIYIYRGKICTKLKAIIDMLTEAGISDVMAAELVSKAKKDYNNY